MTVLYIAIAAAWTWMTVVCVLGTRREACDVGWRKLDAGNLITVLAVLGAGALWTQIVKGNYEDLGVVLTTFAAFLIAFLVDRPGTTSS